MWKPCADALAVDDGHGREQGLAAFLTPHHHQGPEGFLQISPGAPAAVMVIDGPRRRIPNWKPTPLAARIDDVQYSLQHVIGVMSAKSRTHGWEDKSQQYPLAVAETLSI